jgi:GAF domain-containing protein
MATELAPVVATSDAWRPEQFILQGRYCSRPSIYASLEEAREEVGASDCLLLAADDGALLRTLCFQAPKSLGSECDLVGLLRSSNDLNSVDNFPAMIHPAAALDSRTPLQLAKILLESLRRLAREKGEGVLADWLGRPDWVPATAPTDVDGARIAVILLFLEPADGALVDVDGVTAVDASDRVLELTCKVNATAQADVRRDAAIMARLDNELDPADYAESTVNLQQAADSLVKLAVRVSRSRFGACYVFDHGAKAMRCVAATIGEEDESRGWHYEPTLFLDSESLTISCFRNRRSIQLPPGLPTDEEVKPSCIGSTGPNERTLELATPIVGPLASPKAPSVGVLTVARLGDSVSSYGAYDLAVLRNIGLRLALINATANTEAAARTFADLSTRATAQIRAGAAQGVFRATRMSAAPASSRPPLPDDLLMTLPAIQSGLETLGRITGSHSATFRAALPAEAPAGPHGLTLRRVAAYPTHWLEGDGELQGQDEGGVNWRVALSGKPQYVPVVGDEDAYLGRRKETLSELCVPVLVEGRVIGIVNLESGSRNAYEALVTTAQAFAAHVGLAIADARIAIASVLHDYATQIVRRGHELGGQECRALRKLAAEAPEGDWPDRLRHLANEIEAKSKGLRTFTSETEPHPPESLTFPELVAAKRDEIKLTFADVSVDPDCEWSAYPQGVADIVGQALRDILVNVKRHSTKDYRRAGLAVHQGLWGGQTHDVLTITNSASSPLSAVDAANAFRGLLARESPHRGDDADKGLRVPQLGAYLAGSMARRVGGDVHLWQDPVGTTRVTLSIPSKPRQTDWGGGT